jgi:hypothetical protein
MTQMPKLMVGLMVAACLLLGSAPISAAADTAVPLTVPQGTAFAVLGHSCGGIQEQQYAFGFGGVNGDPTGFAYLSTRCGGSGRGGGYHVTTYTAWMSVTWDFGATVGTYAKLAAPPPGIDPSMVYTDAHGATEYTTCSSTGTACHAWLTVPMPGAPTNVQATLSAGQYTISWTPDPATAGLITGSTITVVPSGGTAVIVAPVNGTVTSALIGPLAPSTTYSVTVTNTDAAGTSPASDPIQVITGAAKTRPGAPKSVVPQWLGPSYLNVSWSAPANPGDSPIDQYQVKAKPYDADPGAPGVTLFMVDGSMMSTQLSLDGNYDWAIRVRAHNAAGWSAWSTRVIAFANN